MSLSNEDRTLIVNRELAKAKEAFDDILFLQQGGRLSAAANRLYYAVFHAVSALLIHDGHQVARHNGSHILFSQYYIKTGILPSDFGKLYNNLQTLREKRDYNCFFDVKEEDITAGVTLAQQLIQAIEGLIQPSFQ